MKNQKIFTAADGNYSLQAQVLALSLAKTQDTNTTLIVLGNGWSTRDVKVLSDLQSDKLSIELHQIESSLFKDVKLSNKFPLATAYNILAPRYFFSDDERLLYVDADTIVREPLDELFDTPIENGLGACLDAHIGWVASPSMWRPWREEGLSPNSPYLNTGVLLIDPKRWNSRELTEKTLAFLKKYELPCVDQDALNFALRGEFTELPPKFNSMPYHILAGFRNIDLVTDQSEIETALRNPVIVHFHRSFLGKPWEFGCIHPARRAWQTLAYEVNPKWRRKIDIVGFARRQAATWAKMLRIDDRVGEIF